MAAPGQKDKTVRATTLALIQKGEAIGKNRNKSASYASCFSHTLFRVAFVDIKPYTLIRETGHKKAGHKAEPPHTQPSAVCIGDFYFLVPWFVCVPFPK